VKRLFFYLLRITLFIALAVWLAGEAGTAHIVWHGYEIESSAAFLALMVLALGLCFLSHFAHRTYCA